MPYLDVEAVAARCQIKPETVRWHRKRGNLPPADTYFGRSPVWEAETIEAWQSERERRWAEQRPA